MDRYNTYFCGIYLMVIFYFFIPSRFINLYSTTQDLSYWLFILYVQAWIIFILLYGLKYKSNVVWVISNWSAFHLRKLLKIFSYTVLGFHCHVSK